MTYVCSDIHGNFEAYMKAVNILKENDNLIIIGDVIDRGKDGIRIIQDIMKRDNVELLLGNHEWMLVVSLSMIEENTEFIDNWISETNGGRVTLESIMMLTNLESQEILNYLKSCKLCKIVETSEHKFFLTHGMYKKGLTEDLTVCSDCTKLTFDVLWGSPFKRHPISDYTDEYVYIHGHVPCIRKDGTVSPLTCKNIIDIDGGLMYGGALILFCLDNLSYELLT